MKRSFLLASLLASTGACHEGSERDPELYACEVPAEVELEIESHPKAKAYADALARAVRGKLPGAVWLVRDADGVWAGAEGSADLDLQVPLQTCSRTRIASVTKSMIAVAALTEVGAGQLELEGGIREHLSASLAGRVPQVSDIRVRHLLEHSSGLADYSGFAWGIALFNDPHRTWTSQDFLQQGLAKKPLFAPGTRHEYANTNYLLLGEVLEGSSGLAHEELLATRVFEPLNLRETRYSPDEYVFDDVARGYLDLYGDRVLVDASETYAINGVNAAGGVVSNAFDLAAFLDGVFRSDTVLDDVLRTAATDFLPTSGEYDFTGYGLGLERWETAYGLGIGHTGQELGYLTFAYYFPEADLTFVFWTNASSISTPTEENLTGEIVFRILPVLLDAAFSEPG